MPYWVGSNSVSAVKPSLACLSDSEIRRRSRSMSMTLTITSSLTWTTCSGISTCRSASSEMCTRPSMPSSTRTNAPNGTSLVTRPGTTCPIWWVLANCCQGSSWVDFSDSETRSRSMSTSSTSTVTSWPTSTTSPGWSMCFQDSSDTCTSPSTPPRSTKAPKLTMEETTPLRIWPFCSVFRKFWRTSDCVCSSQARRDKTTLLRFLSSSMIFASISLPVTTPSSSLIFSIVPQARSYCARFLERISRPSLSSFWRTRASMCSPLLTTSCGSTSCLIESSRDGMTPSVLYPMSSRTSSLSTLTTVPSTMSPSLKYLMVSSIAARKASSEPMSLTATLGVEVASVLLVVMCRWTPDTDRKRADVRHAQLNPPWAARSDWTCLAS